MIEVKGLRRTFTSRSGEVEALKGVDIRVPDRQFFTLLGPSGCGKSTTLRCIAGLERPTSGEIIIDGRTVFSSQDKTHVPPETRGLAMVFQSYAIWPHMSCFENAAFPLRSLPRRSRPSRREIESRVVRALERVQLAGLEKRPATDLSGGQKQRLALARSLVMEPRALLLDEPLSNLDARLRDDMRAEIRALQRELDLSVIYVTHDQAEALSMSNLIAVMRDGLVEQIGTPEEIYHEPATRFVAEFVGELNLLPGTPVNPVEGGGIVKVRTPVGDVVATAGRSVGAGGCHLMFRPENATVHHLAALADRERPNGFEARVSTGYFNGSHTMLEARAEDLTVSVQVGSRHDFRDGDSVWIAVPTHDLRVLE